MKWFCLECGRPRFNPWVRKIPWRRKWQPTPVLLPGKSYGWRRVVGYCPWGHKESDTVAAAAKSVQLCPTLCNPIDSSPPGSPVPGILQARILEWVAVSFSNPWKGKVKVKLLSRVWLRDPRDCSLPRSSIHGIFQARVLEWVAVSFSRGSSWPRDWTWVFHIAGRRFTIWATREVNKAWLLGSAVVLLPLRGRFLRLPPHYPSLVRWVCFLQNIFSF